MYVCPVPYSVHGVLSCKELSLIGNTRLLFLFFKPSIIERSKESLLNPTVF
ncbi:ORF92 [Agrotis segetum granulovirus]|uniref:ORF92 n=1 Tax=Agrotis segetum granulosis virus TaxID=10464 RepID=Q6QXL1_GVAS|nr:hypothetical protein AsGV106 [Agrotis segetum granulovirus]AAS82647.1 ORF92 [Agrotis segetum granulovirus]AKN63379.1 hypothetical protein AsGV106 [Agrotis segetum granulovirus]